MGIVDEIQVQLNAHDEHILSILRDNNESTYYADFIRAILLLEEQGMLSTKKQKQRIYNKLLIGTKQSVFNRNMYLQGVSELMFWIYAADNNLEIQPDCKLNTNNGTDVDIRIKAKDKFINIEVKCPEQEDASKELLYLSYAYRVPEASKTDVDNLMKRLTKMIQPAIRNHPEKGIVGSEVKKTQDNKVITYMDSAQTKFTYADTDVNILVISVPSKEMQLYYNYLCNPASGILTEDGLEAFNRKKDEFDKVDLVLLTNIVSGHDKNTGIDAWKLSNYCTIGFLNANSKGIRKGTKPLSLVKDILPDEGLRFKEKRDIVLKRDWLRGIPADEMLMYEYLANRCPELYRPDEKRVSWF